MSFPTESDTISLTNWVELITVDSICNNRQNQFNMIPFKDATLRSIMCKYGVTEKDYAVYWVTDTLADRFKIWELEFNCDGAYLVKKKIYFFVNKALNCQNNLGTRLFELYRSKFGTARMGSVYFPEPLYRIPIQMPSRGLVFR